MASWRKIKQGNWSLIHQKNFPTYPVFSFVSAFCFPFLCTCSACSFCPRTIMDGGLVLRSRHFKSSSLGLLFNWYTNKSPDCSMSITVNFISSLVDTNSSRFSEKTWSNVNYALLLVTRRHQQETLVYIWSSVQRFCKEVFNHLLVYTVCPFLQKIARIKKINRHSLKFIYEDSLTLLLS